MAIMAAVCLEQCPCAELLSAKGGPGLLKERKEFN
jgi:hypothetical protein